jgi:hypothetical protein
VAVSSGMRTSVNCDLSDLVSWQLAVRGEQSEERTIHDLGIPFLFEAPISQAHEYRDRSRCSRRKEGVHCFELGIDEDVVVHCPVCNAEVALDADSGAGGMCQTCRSHRVLRFSSGVSRLPGRIHQREDLFEPRNYITGLQELLLFIDLR